MENAEIYTLPDEAPPIAVSGFGRTSATLAGRIGDGFVSTIPDPELLSAFRASVGDGKPTSAGTKVCWGTDEAAARRTAHRLWANEQLAGELAQVAHDPAHRAG